jgi:hypothetical protein
MLQKKLLRIAEALAQVSCVTLSNSCDIGFLFSYAQSEILGLNVSLLNFSYLHILHFYQYCITKMMMRACLSLSF